MKKILLATALILGASNFAAAGTETVRVVIDGLRTPGTKVETTRQPNGAITISADCSGTIGECASATYTITNNEPELGSVTQFEIYDGGNTQVFNGGFIDFAVSTTDHGKAFQITLSQL